jgi:hypothetical protein
MRVLKAAVLMSVLVGAAACGRDVEPRTAARSNDLSWLDSLGVSDAPARAIAPAAASPTELGLAASDSAAKTLVAAAPPAEPEAKAASSTTTRRSTARRSSSTRRRSSASSSGTYAGNSGGYESSGTYRAPRAVVKRNTRRDAAIGAAGGAVIGAVAGGSRHRVRNAVIGGVVGGAAGAIIGHHVDKKTVYVP